MFLSGRSPTSVAAVAQEIEVAGGRAHADVVDALDSAAVEEYCDSVVDQKGSLDIEFNATGPRLNEYANGKPLANCPSMSSWCQWPRS
jgi:NADP-dependent 3-hydroxy acid dehydrogenase YdfG